MIQRHLFSQKSLFKLRYRLSTQTKEFKELEKINVYSNRKTMDLIIAIFVQKLCKFKILVDNGTLLYNSSVKILGNSITNSLVKGSIGKVFIAGDSIDELGRTIKNLNEKSNIAVITSYSHEAEPGVEISDETMNNITNEYIKSIRVTQGPSLQNAIALKCSALGDIESIKYLNILQQKVHEIYYKLKNKENLTSILQNMGIQFDQSQLESFYQIVLELEDSSSQLTHTRFMRMVHPYYIFDLQKQNNHILQQLFPLNKEQKLKLKQYTDRINKIVNVCAQVDIPVFMDSEQSYIQYGIESVTDQLQKKYNRIKPIVFTTTQNYLKRGREAINYEIEKCQEFKYPIGIKMVRGAYLVEENYLSQKYNYSSPICDTIEQTHDTMNKNVSNLVQSLQFLDKSSKILIASHNETTLNETIEHMEKYGIDKTSGQVCFAQLLGLGDHITYKLKFQGHSCYKYLPYGQIHILIPYLIRRAQESYQMLDSVDIQINLMKKEIKKRFIK